MLNNNTSLYAMKLLTEAGRDVLYFPLWWYGRGLYDFLLGLGRFLKNREKGLALSVWVKNFWRPMYGQTDWQGILISIFMRLFMIIIRGFIMLFYVLAAALLLLLWLLAPPFVIYQILYQFNVSRLI